MPEIRKDIISGRQVIFASERFLRPNDYDYPEGKCPFCPGNESETPPAVMEIKSRGKWIVRVVPNKFPALREDEPSGEFGKDGIYEKMPGKGVHEVVVETPFHGLPFYEMDDGRIFKVLGVLQSRAREMKKRKYVKYVIIFKNLGRGAGASLEHPHSQIVAMPILPLRVLNEINGAEKYHADNSSCAFCDMIKAERREKKRMVGENGEFAAFEPYSSRFSFETWILPKLHRSHFENYPLGRLRALAPLLKDVLRKLDASLGKADYNLLYHSMPAGGGENGFFHWHIEIMPKLSQMAGFEWGTGFYINAVAPEESARILNAGEKFRQG